MKKLFGILLGLFVLGSTNITNAQTCPSQSTVATQGLFFTNPTTTVTGTPDTMVSNSVYLTTGTCGSENGGTGSLPVKVFTISSEGVGTAPQIPLSALNLPNGKYFAVVTVTDASGLQSAQSNEVGFTISNPPQAPGTFSVK